MAKISIKSTPSAKEVWSGIGGHFDSLGQIINEFVDNSISNFDGHNPPDKFIYISLTELPHDKVKIQIEDTGTGIQDLNKAFTLGCRTAPDSPLNEHGFGLKHALASANPDNDAWSICTRTEENVKNGTYIKVSAPYLFEGFQAEECDVGNHPWEGRYNSSGTLVTFVCTKGMYKTLAKGIRGGVTIFRNIAALLYEDLGFVYSEIIKNARANITLKITTLEGKSEFKAVGALEPDWVTTISPGTGTEKYDLGNGAVDIEYHFGTINAKPTSDSGELDNTKAKKYYQASMSTSGVEVRINGRVICYNIFKEIWNKEKHNSYNSFLVIINLKSNNSNALPKTRTSKNGLREGDPQLAKLYQWILGKVNDPPKKADLATNETDLFAELRDYLHKFNRDPNAVIECERHAFTTTGNGADKARIDLYEYTNGQLTIYEGKKDKTTIKDVYQLRMYWDGLVYDGLSPDKGILVSAEHPQSVKDMVQVVNSMKDMNGKKYCFECKSWMNLGIQHST